MNLKNGLRSIVFAVFGEDRYGRVIHSMAFLYRLFGFYQRFLFKILDPENYNLTRQKYDVVFMLVGPHQGQNISVIIANLRRCRPNTKSAIAFSGSKEELPDILKDKDNIIIYNFLEIYTRLLDTKILYATNVRLIDLFRSNANRPKDAAVVHAIISMSSVEGMFDDDAFDMYDYILCAGPHQIDSIRDLSKRRKQLLGKWLVPAGYPRLDFMRASLPEKLRPETAPDKFTIVYAPTHLCGPNERLASVQQHGEAIIESLLSAGYRVIFRPHPASYLESYGRGERGAVELIGQRFSENSDFALDLNPEYLESYSSADMMVTDLSGTGFTFSFCREKPTIFFAPDISAEKGLNGIQFQARERIGAVARSISELVSKIDVFQTYDGVSEIQRFRDETVFNVDHSGIYIVNFLDDIIHGRKRTEWTYLEEALN